MNFFEYHNHKWARNLSLARRLLEQSDLEAFYRGQELPDNDIYPGMRVMAAYWTSVEHEMKMRLAMLLKGAGHEDWRWDAGLIAQKDTFFQRYLDDMRELVVRENIVPPQRIDDILRQLDTPANWSQQMHSWQEASEAGLSIGKLDPDLVEAWFNSCLRSVANYNQYLIWGGVCAAALVKNSGAEALKKAIDATSEAFKWEISKEFYANVMPAAGFEDIGDVMELGMRGMYSDQYYQTGEEQQLDEDVTVKHSVLKNCELAGIYYRAAEWNGLPQLALGYGICRYCEVHGEATMQISIPPMYSPAYRTVESLGIDGKTCFFELTLTPSDDMERLMMVQEKVFGASEEE
jgi:hypothetical protein